MYARYANYILFKLKESSTASLTLQSADLFYDTDTIWSMWVFTSIIAGGESSSKKLTSAIVSDNFYETFSPYRVHQYLQRFKENKANMLSLLQIAFLKDNCPELQINAANNTFASEEELQTWRSLQKLAVIVPSILAKLDDLDQAILVIKQALRIFSETSGPHANETLALLHLMHASFRVHKYFQNDQE